MYPTFIPIRFIFFHLSFWAKVHVRVRILSKRTRAGAYAIRILAKRTLACDVRAAEN